MRLKIVFTLLLSSFSAVSVYAQNLPSFADLAEKLLPSVVNISTATLNDGSDNESAFANETLGSGFIISKDGYIVTNQHVIDKAKTINVILHNNEKREAQIIGEDNKTDLALLKITTETPLTPVIFGNSDALRVGDWVLAIGNPFGLGGSVTAGIVSAKSRDIASGSYDNFIQTDAAINQGNSGGPMFNLNGEVIGVNSAIFSPTGNSMGVGFATPAKMAQWVIGQLRNKGKVTRGWIGISIRPDPLRTDGIQVTRVTEASPAQKAGILPGDLISKFNTMPITSATNLSRIIAESAIGETLSFEIIRNLENITIKVQTAEMPEDKSQKSTTLPQENIKNQTVSPLGLTVETLTPELLQKYNLPNNSKGVIITQIDGTSDASSKGLQIGSLITKVDKKEVLDTTAFNDYIQEAQNEHNRPVLLTIQNSEAEHFVAVKLKP